jgi:hypothetical protein
MSGYTFKRIEIAAPGSCFPQTILQELRHLPETWFAQGGFYIKDVPGDEKKDLMGESFRMSRSTGYFTYVLTGSISSRQWTETCAKHSEKFKF